LRTEEKGSDVNLATHLIHDAHSGAIDCAVVISNNSDLAEAMRIVHDEVGLEVGLISPTTLTGRHPSLQLLTRHADFVKRIRRGVLRSSQFPDELRDAKGPIVKPRGARAPQRRSFPNPVP